MAAYRIDMAGRKSDLYFQFQDNHLLFILFQHTKSPDNCHQTVCVLLGFGSVVVPRISSVADLLHHDLVQICPVDVQVRIPERPGCTFAQ